jgi:hypothetical protein
MLYNHIHACLRPNDCRIKTYCTDLLVLPMQPARLREVSIPLKIFKMADALPVVSSELNLFTWNDNIQSFGT